MSACRTFLTRNTYLAVLFLCSMVSAAAEPTVFTGIKTLDGSSEPLIFEDDVVVEAGAVVTIKEGSEVVMSPGASWYIEGQLSVTGTSERPITFSSSSRSQPWGALCVSSTASVLIEHATLEHPSYGEGEFRSPGGAVTMHGGQVQLDYVTIDTETHGFYGTSATLTLNNCTFLMGDKAYDYIYIQYSDVYIDGCSFIAKYGFPDDIYDTGHCTTVVTRCFFDTCTGDAIDIGEETECELSYNQIVGSFDNAITFGESSTGKVHHNVLLGTTSGVEIKYGSYADVYNNTIVGSTYGLQILGYAGGTAYNNIFFDCDTLENAEKGLFVEYDHNLSNTFIPRGDVGLLGDPRFIDTRNMDFNLRANSPAINSGRPNITDPDGSRSDIGAFWFNGDTSAEEDLFEHLVYVDDTDHLHIETEYPASYEVWVFTEDGRVIERFSESGRGAYTTKLPTKLSAAPLFIAVRLAVGPKFSTKLLSY